MTTEQANKERWRDGISAGRAVGSSALYGEALDAAGGRRRALRAAAAPLARAPPGDEDLARSRSDRDGYAIGRGRPDAARVRRERPRLRRRHRPQRHARPRSLLGRHSRFHGCRSSAASTATQGPRRRRARGKATPEEFLRKLRGFWWHRVRIGERALRAGDVAGAGTRQGARPAQRSSRGPLRSRARAVRGGHAGDLVGGLPQPLLRPAQPAWPPTRGKPVLVEMSCFTIAAAARRWRGSSPRREFVHSVRDGRDSGSSKVSLSARSRTIRPTSSRGIELVGRTACARPRRACAGSEPDRARLPDQPRRARLRRPRGRLRGAPRLPRRRRRTGDARVLRARDERRRGPPASAGARGSRGRAGSGSSSATRPTLARLDAEGYHCARSCAAPTSRHRVGIDGAALRRRVVPAAGDLVFIGGTGRSGTHVLASCSTANRVSPACRSSPASTATSGACRICSGAGSRWTASSRSCGLLVASRPGRRPAARPLQPADARAVRCRSRALRGRLRATDPVGRAGGSSATCCGRWPTEEGKPGLVEMSSHNVREAQTLRRLFPEARFVHAVRDGRDAASSVVAKTWGPRHHPQRDRLVGRSPARDRGRSARRRGRRRVRARPEQLSWSLSTTSSGAIARRPTAGCSTSSRWMTTRRCASSSTSR